MEEAATFISLHNGKGERTLFSLLFSNPPFSFDRGRAGGGGGRREEGKRLLDWHGRRRIANSCNITAHRSKETFGTRSRVSRMCCVPCLISWRNPCQREAGKCQKLRGGRESFFWLCSVSLLLQKEEKGGNSASLLPLPSLLPPAISPLFNCLYIFSVSFFSSRHYGGSTAKMQGGGKTWENEERAFPLPLPSPSICFAIIQKKTLITLLINLHLPQV